MKMPIDDIFRDAESDGLFWLTLRDMIQTSLALLPAVEWRPRISFPDPVSGDSNTRRTRFEAIRAFGLSDEGAQQAFLHTMREHEWPTLTPPQAWSLTIALSEVVRFLDLCFVPDGERTLTLFRSLPTDNLSTAALWFYFRWWHDVGIRCWLADVTRDEAAFYTHFDRPQE
jgi:hypothetical protein